MTDPSVPDLRHLFYVSRSTAEPDDLPRVLDSARRNNAQHGLTGALVYTGGHFAQVLEGPAAALERTMQAIEADPRHTALRRLIDGPLAERRFAQWAMALVDAPGADDVLEDLLSADEVTPDRAARLCERLFAGPVRDA